MLTDAAFNALLKTLEEPPAHVLFILATTEVHKVPATIASRCQRFDFRRITLEGIIERLQHIAHEEGLSVPDEGFRLIARTATGSLRDAENLLEQLVTVYGPAPAPEDVRELLGLTGDARIRQLVSHLVARDLAAGLQTLQDVANDGVDFRQFHRELLEWLRMLLLVKAGSSQLADVSEADLAELRGLAGGAVLEDVARYLQHFAEADLKTDPYSALPLELALVESLVGDATPTSPLAAKEDDRTPVQLPTSRQAPRSSSGRENIARSEGSASPPSSNSLPPTIVQVRPPAPSREVPAELAPRINSTMTPVTSATPPADATPAQRLEALRRAFVAEVKQRNAKAAVLLNTKWLPQDDGDGALVFVFPYEFHKKQIEASRDHLRALEDATATLLGATYRIRCVFNPRQDEMGQNGPSAFEEHSSAQDNPLVRLAIEEGALLIEEPGRQY
jgi:DNA polymerase-3 subunit gamma/tau